MSVSLKKAKLLAIHVDLTSRIDSPKAYLHEYILYQYIVYQLSVIVRNMNSLLILGERKVDLFLEI